MNELVVKTRSRTLALGRSGIAVPAVIADAGEHAARRFLEFFAATIRNKNTRMAYTGPHVPSSPGSSGITLASWPRSSPFMSLPI
jgi:hypothetical protein